MNDVYLEQEEEKHRETQRMERCLEAAQLISEGTPRSQAISIVKDRIFNRNEAVENGHFIQDELGDVEGFIEDDLNSNPMNSKNPAQILAIAKELFDADTFENEA